MKIGFLAVILALAVFFLLIPSSFSANIGEDDYTSNFTTISSGGTNASAPGVSGPSIISQTAYNITELGDIENKMGLMHLLGENVAPVVYLENPANNTVNTTDRTPDFVFNVSDMDNLYLDCDLWLDNGTAFIAGNDPNVLNATPTTITSTKELSDDFYWWWINCSDGQDWNASEKWRIEILVSNITMQITRIFFPDTLMAEESETINVNTTVKILDTTHDVYQFNMTDDVPWDFTAPLETDVKVYFYDYSEGTTTEITTNATANITIIDQGGTDPTLVAVNITNVSRTDAGSYLQNNDSIRLIYDMTSSQLGAGDYRLMYTNVTLIDNQSYQEFDFILENLTAFDVVLRGYKTITTPDPSNPQNFTVVIRFRSMGGPTSDIYITDYLPDGAKIWDHNVTIWNNTQGSWVQLYNSSDYYIDLDNPVDDILPDGTYVDLYYYNFSYAFTNWEGSLYDNDTVKIMYNVSVVGGGQWVLPTIPSGYDPTYKKHIKTELNSELNIPLFDVEVTLLTLSISPGETIIALLKLLNVGGPKARVDVTTTYSAKTMQGDLITEATDTFAVTSEKEKELTLFIPSDVTPGRYTFEALVTYVGREAISTRVFEVTGEAAGAPMIPLTEGLLYVVIIVVVIVALMYVRLRKKVEKIEYRSHWRQ